MTEHGRDPFDEEMEALRLEVGRFVLRLLKDDAAGHDVLGQVGDRLAAHVSDKARPVAALNADDRRFLDQLSRRIERLDGDVRRLRSTRPSAPGDPDAAGRSDDADTAGAPAWSSDGSGLISRNRLGDLPAWLPWAVSGLLGAALIAVVAFLLLGQRPASPNASPPPAAAAPPGAEADLRWDAVLATVETWPEQERLAARRILCGEDGAEAVCPSWAERSAVLETDAEGRAAVARIVAQALSQADCATIPQAGAAAADAERTLDPACLLGDGR